ncbi:MAG: HDOD domain-containing protein [Desulfobacterales bacterium]
MATAEEIIGKFNNIKTLPHVALRLTKLISKENSSLSEFEKLIRVDPSLVVRILRMVNSSYYALKERVDSIARALVFIGMKNLRNMVVTEALRDIFKPTADEATFSRTKLWLHCAAVSISAQMISERILGEKGEDAFLCGILHDIGMIVEDQLEHDSFIQACKAYESSPTVITAAETEHIGTNHCELGHLLAQDWELPVTVQDGVRYHHDNLTDTSASSIPAIIQISEYLVTKLDYGALPGMKATLSPSLATYVRNNIGEYKALLEDLPEEIDKAKEIYESDD